MCRHCGLLCCGLCTSKRLVLCEVSAGAGPSPGRRKKRKEGEPERVCDGCFNKLRFDCLEAENRERELAKLVESSVKLSPRPGADNGQGGNLFAGAISAGATAGAGAGASGGAGGGPSTSSRAKSGVASTTAVMQDALQSLNERGERLNQLQERSEAMSQVSCGKWWSHCLISLAGCQRFLQSCETFGRLEEKECGAILDLRLLSFRHIHIILYSSEMLN